MGRGQFAMKGQVGFSHLDQRLSDLGDQLEAYAARVARFSGPPLKQRWPMRKAGSGRQDDYNKIVDAPYLARAFVLGRWQQYVAEGSDNPIYPTRRTGP